MSSSIYVTRPSLAPLREVMPYLESIWETGIMTHNGPLVQQLEKELSAYIGVGNVVCVASGTCALQLAIRALDLTGEIITTPFTFIATAGIINWERCRPVFTDICPDTWNIDPEGIEARVTPATTAILPVHVFSAPCAVAPIEEIARKYSLRVIYDAAHAMAVEVDGHSVLSRGDVSCLSFHATKLFNTGEGGACVTADDALARRIRRLRFFGFDEEKEISDIGMNAKMTEINAGLGLANLVRLDEFRRKRRANTAIYADLLANVPFVTLQRFDPQAYNYSYLPVCFETESMLERVVRRMAKDNIHPRRYFFPSLNTVPIFRPGTSLPVAERMARTILCLPLYDTLTESDIERICHHIRAE